MNKIKKRFLESSFFKVFSIIKNNKQTYIYTIALDLLFLALILFIGKSLGSLIPKDPTQIMAIFKTNTNLLLFVIIYPIIYYLFIIFIYSIVKLTTLNLIKPLFEKAKFTFKRLGKFYLLNLIVFLIFFFSALIILAVFALILRADFLKYVLVVLLIPFLFFLYSIINISHTLFIKDEKKKLIKKSFKIAFNKIKNYGMFITWDIILILIYLVIYNIIHLIFRFTLFANKELLANYGSAYLKIFNIVSLIVFYLIIAFNRIYFYKTIDKNVLP